MVSIDDMGQGNESIRILGIRWLPTGNASKSVDTDGKVQKSQGKSNDRTDENDAQDQSPDADADGGAGHDSKESRQDSDEKAYLCSKVLQVQERPR